MRETMLAKVKINCVGKGEVVCTSMPKGDLEAKRVELKSNQSTSHLAAVATAPTASKPAAMVEKNSRGFQKPSKVL